MPEDSPPPSLELPKLSLRGRRRASRPSRAPTPDSGAQATGSTTTTVAETPAAAEAAEPAAPPASETAKIPGRTGGTVAAVVVGAVTGLGLVGLTWASLEGCQAVQGTASCGGAGYPLLGLIVAVMVVVGALLLRLARVPEPGTTSFLALGTAAILALLLLVDRLTDPAMIVVIPLVSAACYAAVHTFTRRIGDQTDSSD